MYYILFLALFAAATTAHGEGGSDGVYWENTRVYRELKEQEERRYHRSRSSNRETVIGDVNISVHSGSVTINSVDISSSSQELGEYVGEISLVKIIPVEFEMDLSRQQLVYEFAIPYSLETESLYRTPIEKRDFRRVDSDRPLAESQVWRDFLDITDPKLAMVYLTEHFRGILLNCCDYKDWQPRLNWSSIVSAFREAKTWNELALNILDLQVDPDAKTNIFNRVVMEHGTRNYYRLFPEEKAMEHNTSLDEQYASVLQIRNGEKPLSQRMLLHHLTLRVNLPEEVSIPTGEILKLRLKYNGLVAVISTPGNEKFIATTLVSATNKHSEVDLSISPEFFKSER